MNQQQKNRYNLPIQAMKINMYDTKLKSTLAAEVKFDRMSIIGIVTTIVGIGFFLKYAFD
jgi:hypothetical protein